MKTTLTFPSLLSACLLAYAPAQPLSWDNFSPALHLNVVTGTTDADEAMEFAPGAHDPNRDERVQVQGLEPSLSFRYGEHVQAFATATIFTDTDDEWDAEWEEYFLKLAKLPGGLELRGGRYLNRIGFHNPTHLHSWATVDAPLANSLLLGEEGLATEGVELSWYPGKETVFSLSYGKPPEHEHGHAEHGEEDDHHHGVSGVYEELRPTDELLVAGLRSTWRRDDFLSLTGSVGGGTGETEARQDAWFAQAGLELAWRENGFEPGGNSLRWRTEAFWLGADTHAEHEDHDEEHEHEHEDEHHHADESHEAPGSVDAFGITSLLEYSFNDVFTPFLRFDHVDSLGALDAPQWQRWSVGCTYTFAQDPQSFLRLQANFDEQGDEEAESVWLQFGMSFGGGEVR